MSELMSSGQDTSSQPQAEEQSPSQAEQLVTVGSKEEGTVVGVPQSQVPEWLLRDGKIPEEKPEWLKKDTMEDQAKAYAESEKRIGELKREVGEKRKEAGLFAEGIPEEYDFSGLNDESFNVDMEAPLMQDFLGYCKENKIPQNMATKMVELYKSDFVSSTVDTSAELSKLGGDANIHMMNMRNWIVNNTTPEAAQNILNMVRTADDFKALMQLKDGIKEQSNNIPTDIKSSPGLSKVEEYKNMISSNYKELRNNPELQQQMIKAIEEELNK